jgi:hypothetical protein
VPAGDHGVGCELGLAGLEPRLHSIQSTAQRRREGQRDRQLRADGPIGQLLTELQVGRRRPAFEEPRLRIAEQHVRGDVVVPGPQEVPDRVVDPTLPGEPDRGPAEHADVGAVARHP